MRPVPPRPKGELERLAVRRLAAMRYRLAGATYSVIAEKLTEDPCGRCHLGPRVS